MTPLRIGTRASPLALWQAHYVLELLRPLADARPVEIVHVATEGDRDQSASLTQIGGLGVFTKEIQRALLDGRVDVAVHSLKDLPTEAVPGVVLAAVPPRGSTGDVLVTSQLKHFDELPQGARIATGSLRRRAQLLNRRPDLRLEDIRGNVQTRLNKLRDDGYDGLVLAQAGLERLGLAHLIAEVLDPAWMLPAVGQGALGLECRSDDAPTRTLLEALNDPQTRSAVEAERSLLYHLGGGCQVPLGAFAAADGDRLMLRGAVLSLDGTRRLAGEETGPPDDAVMLGQRVAVWLRERGAGELLALR